MDRKIIVENFFRVGDHGDKTLAEEDLGWGESLRCDAQSDDPETVFRYFVEIVGFNILFYWVEDRRFYTIETEKVPVEVRRIFPNPNWDGECEYTKAGLCGYPSTCAAGELLATFDEPAEIWDGLRIDGVPIGKVLERSLILDLD